MSQTILEKFLYCPVCGKSLKKVNDHLLQCTACMYKLYLNPSPTVGVIIEKGEDEILLVKRGVDPKKGTWDTPGGFILPGETAEEAAVREIKEELGIDIHVVEIFGTSYSDDYVYQGILIPILGIDMRAKIIRGELKPEDDVSDCAFFSKEEAIALDFGLVGAQKTVQSYIKKYSLAVIE